MISCSSLWTMSNIRSWDRRGRDCMVVGFTTICAISAYHHESYEFEPCSGEVYSIQHHVIKFFSYFRLVVVFVGYSGFLQ
jgi:hypothetical protein